MIERHWTAELARQLASSYACENGTLEGVTTDEGVFDHVLTDPPYDRRTQDNTRRGRKTDTSISDAMPLGFDPMNAERRARWARWIATACRGWALVFSDHESSMLWAADLERAGMMYVRSAIWVRTYDDELGPERPTHSGAPQFRGDRPAVGHEVIVCCHARNRGARTPLMQWNGGGKAAVYTAPVVRGSARVHTTQKPLRLIRDLVADFFRPGQIIADPFAGSGTTMVAAKLAGIGCAGIELDPKYASYAARRAAAATATNTANED